jgi:hypothetical protein|tara:strand:+ start:25354 stop:26595 length:1242 start_codon:yes stop_codon:yes gene_type:complete
MTVPEMHISINQGVQKIASSQVDNLLPQEIDLELNKAQDKFVKGRYNKFGNKYQVGFEGSQKRIDDLRTLIKETSVTTTFKGQVGENLYIDRADLPLDEDYMFLLNQRSLVVHNNCESIQSCFTNVSGQEGGVQLYGSWLELEIQEFTSANFGNQANATYAGLSLGIEKIEMALDYGGVSMGIFSVYNGTMAPLACNMSNYTNSQYISPGFIVSTQTPLGGPTSLQASYGGGLVLAIWLPIGYTLSTTLGQISAGYPDCMIAVTRYNCTQSATILGGVDYVRNPNIFTAATHTNRSCADINYTTSAVNRYSQLDDIYTLLEDPFNKTKHTSPLATINGSSVDVYTDETFYVPKVKFTYLKIPRRIVSTTGSVQNTDLPIHAHQEIVDMAISSILEGISDPRYQTFRAEEIRSE